jgi:hypothetical protein
MSMVIGRISDQTIVEVSGLMGNINMPSFSAAIATNYGGQASDYTIYTMSSAEQQRYENGDQYSVVWSVNVITGLDFYAEDTKRWIRLTSNKTRAAADGVDSIVITINVMKADQSSIDTTYNGTIVFNVQTDVNTLIECVFVAGVCTKTLKTTNSRLYYIPTQNTKRVVDDTGTEFRIDQNYVLALQLISPM